MTTSSSRGFPIGLLLAAVLSLAGVVRAEDPPGPADQECISELVLAYKALEAGDGESALGHYRSALGKAVSEPLRFQALFGLGSSYAAMGQPEKAIEPLESARDLASTDASVWYTLGTVYVAAGRLDDGLDALAEAGRQAPDLAVAHYDRCILLSAQGRHADAAEACTAAVEADPELTEAWVGLGVARYHLGAYEEAVEAFGRALELESNHARARYGLGLSQLYADDTRGAKEQYLALKKIDADLAQQLYERIFP